VLTHELRADPVDWHSMSGWKRLVLMGIMVAIPVPMFAASGLAVPLPAVVYRVAVGVAEQTHAVAVRVPGLEAVVAETKQVAREGTIRLAPEELATGGAAPAGATATASTARGRTSAATRAERISRVAKKRELRATPAKTATKDARSGSRATERNEGPQAAHAPAHAAPSAEKRATPVAADDSQGGSAERTSGDPDAGAKPAKEDTKAAIPGSPASPSRPPPPPPPPSPSPSPPPSLTPPPPAVSPGLPVTPPIDSVSDPLPVTPEAQLEEIAHDLREIVEKSPGTRRADRVGQVLEKVESASARLAKRPPDNEGAIGDIKNAIQKLDAALLERVITLAERTEFVTRLETVSLLLKARLK
jgi:hypothetical protein